MGADAVTRADANKLLILENASTDLAVVTGSLYPVDHGSDKLFFYVDVATGGVVEIQGCLLYQPATGSPTEVIATLPSFGTAGSITTSGWYVVTLGAALFSSVRAKTTTKPSAGTARVYMARG